MAPELKWGVIGCGMVSHDFLKAMKNSVLPHKVVAVADDNLDQAENFKKRLELGDESKAYGSFQELFEDPNVEIVYVGIVNFLHHKMVMLALQHDRHVLCEKPLGLNVKEVKEMIDKAHEKKLFLMEGAFSRFFPVWQEIRKHVEEKTLGEITAVHANLAHNNYAANPNRFRQKDGFTIMDTGAIPLLDFGLYNVMLTLFVYNDENPTKILVNGAKSEIGADLWANITLEFSGGRRAFLIYSHADIFPNTAFISFQKGHMVLPEFFSAPEKLEIVYGHPTRSGTEGGVKKEVIEHPLRDDPNKYNFMNSAGFQFEADHVYKCIKNGKLESDNVTHAFSLTLAEILQEIRRQLDVVLPYDS